MAEGPNADVMLIAPLVVGAVVTLGTAVITGFVALRLKAMEQRAVETAAIADKRLTGIEEVGQSTHLLVNSHLRASLKANLILAEELASITGTVGAEARAETARKALAAHDQSQRELDALEITKAEAGNGERRAGLQEKVTTKVVESERREES